MKVMTTSPEGRANTKQEEGCVLSAYPDPATGGDPWTIGYGNTGPDVARGTVWTQAQADAAFDHRLATEFEPAINRGLKVEVNQNQFDALEDFTYNVGTGAFTNSTLLRKLNAGDVQGAADEFAHWCIPAMLIPRREREKARFLGVAVDHPAVSITPTATTEQVQAALGIPADGIFGPQTKAAVKAFQAAHGLTVDGIVGPKTLTALGLHNEPSILDKIIGVFS